MTEQQGDREALDIALGLTAALGTMSDELKAINKRQDEADTFSRRSRFLILMGLASLAVDLVLTLALVFVYGSARNSAVQASAARAVSAAQHTNLIASCRLSNQSRAASITLWTHLGALSKPPATDTRKMAARERRQVAAFLAFVAKVYEPRNCVALYRLPAAPSHARK